MPTTTRAVRHHTVPQFYLKRFTDYTGHLAVLDKLTGEILPRPVHIRHAGVEREFHTVMIDDEPDDTLERIIATAEQTHASGFRLLDTRFPPTPEGRAAVALFVAFQFVRSPRWREILLRSFGDMIKWSGSMVASAARNGNEPTRAWVRGILGDGRDVSEEELDEFLDWSVAGDYEVTVGAEEHLQSLVRHLQDEELPTIVANRSWSIWHTQYPDEFITCDSPIGLWGSPLPNGAAGLGNAEMVTLPLARDRMLVMTLDPGDEGKRRLASPATVRALNAITRHVAKRFVYAHPLTRRAVIQGQASERRITDASSPPP